ncbi:LIC10906 family membrane protein [Leptospira adleri]|uniref:Histidine kinase N-terminal 7TM region domain-containing protein n=1 Tax=Leptospira adleri TaxID=2023186 RepID=A0A2M9YJA1_9LEPT|nr:hypothetical protein CH380_19425 [Leptospira adleri]PJZ61872.1 hypothetical protein CH376_10740 [Leptospira adleri]
MQVTNIFSVSVGLFIVLLGFYVRNVGSGKIAQKHFFQLSLALSVWMFCHGFRILLPEFLRELALNWTLIPILFVPHSLFQIVRLIFRPELKIGSTISQIHLFGFIYMIGSVFLCNAVEIKDPERFTYRPTINYHAIILYEFTYISFSCAVLVRSVFRFSGDLRIRAFLLSAGTIMALLFTIFCVWIMPLFGYFWASKSAFGFIPFFLFWAVAVLHYDTFEIRERILEGERTPILSRYSSSIMMTLYNVLDPAGYNLKLAESKIAVTAGILLENNYLSESLNMNVRARSKKLYDKFKHRLK